MMGQKKSSRLFGQCTLAMLRRCFVKHVTCNVCGWRGYEFEDTIWHQKIRCPQCKTGVRQRLFLAALQHDERFKMDLLVKGQRVLHFAPEPIIKEQLSRHASVYQSADYLRDDCDLQVDMCNMDSIADRSVDVVVAFDVLEHVPSYQSAIAEVFRILSFGGIGIFTVPQKDNLAKTYEDPSIVTPEARKQAYGQTDHLRIFGNDFGEIVAAAGFQVDVVDESSFTDDIVKRHVLFPPVLSGDELASNYRKVYFCAKPKTA